MKCESVKLKQLVDRSISYGIVQPGIPNQFNCVPVVKVNNIVEGLSDISKLDKTSESIAAKNKKTCLQGGEILISVVGTLAKTAIVPMTFKGANINRAVAMIDIKNEITKKYVKYYIDSFMGQNYLNIHTSTGVQPRINIDVLEEMPIELPSLKVQNQISILLSSIDSKIELNNKINDNLLNQAITIFNSFIDRKEKNGCIGDYCTVKSGFAFKSNWWTESGVKVIKIGSINQDELDLDSCSFVEKDKVEKAKEFCVVGGDLLIAMTGATIGKFTMVPSTNEQILVNQRVGKFFLGKNPIERLPYIYCTLKQPDVFSEVINRGQGSAQPNISGGDIMSIPCVILNNDLINDFNKKTQPLFNMLIDNQKENKELSELRDTLLPKLMSGEIDVSDIKLDL